MNSLGRNIAAPAVVAVVVAGFLLTSCARSEDAPSNTTASTPRGSASALSSASGSASPVGDGGITPPLPSPLASYLLGGADLYTIQAAEGELSATCLKRFGFEPVDLGLDRDAAVAEQLQNDTRLYGITDLGEAAVYGYLPESVATGGRSTGPATSASYNFVYTGDRSGGVAVPKPGEELTSPGQVGGMKIPAGGCLGEARQKLWGSPNAAIKDGVAKNLRRGAYEAALADGRVQRVFSKWSSCMASQGFSFQNPLEPDFQRDPASPASAAEINTAVADIGCKKKTDLVGAWNKVDVEYQKKALEEHLLELTEEQETVEAGVKNAAAVLSGG